MLPFCQRFIAVHLILKIKAHVWSNKDTIYGYIYKSVKEALYRLSLAFTLEFHTRQWLKLHSRQDLCTIWCINVDMPHASNNVRRSIQPADPCNRYPSKQINLISLNYDVHIVAKTLVTNRQVINKNLQKLCHKCMWRYEWKVLR